MELMAQPEDPSSSSSSSSASSSICAWSWEDNKLFELALAATDEDNPERFSEISAMLGGCKTAEEVQKHYESLLKDLDSIESGELDHEIIVSTDASQDVCLSDSDYKLYAELKIN